MFYSYIMRLCGFHYVAFHDKPCLALSRCFSVLFSITISSLGKERFGLVDVFAYFTRVA